MKEFAQLDATAQAELVRKKEVKPIELVDAAIALVESFNPKLNAVVTPMYEMAREAAESELPEGPFTGVPFLLKDLVAAYGGVRITSGTRMMLNYVAAHDTELVKRLKRAGLITIGKTNTPEFGILPTTEPELFGASRNPWNINHSTGGSSGGSAAAVAAGMVAMAHANDGGGSIRIPASCCGLFGLKPTRARNPLGPDFGEMLEGFVVEHAVTRSVRDSAALLDATAGPDLGDPYYAPPPARPFSTEVNTPPGRLRIAFSTKAFSETEIHPDCIAAVHDTAKLCEELGHEVIESDITPQIGIDPELFSKSFISIWAAGCTANLDYFAHVTNSPLQKENVEPLTWALYEMGQAVSAVNYIFATQYLQRMSRVLAKFFSQYDAYLTPTLATPPPLLGSFVAPADNPLVSLFRAAAFVPFTPICNITGQPAMSIPLYWNGDNLPIGSHFIGHFGDEGLLFRLAAQLEAARPWANHRPAID
jgi:amidase